MEREWELERMRLYQVRQAHPEWTLPQLAQALARSLSWVKKWLKRFRDTSQPSLAMFKSQSRTPHHHPYRLLPSVRDAILSLRDELKSRYGRVVGAKTIAYHLHKDTVLKQQRVFVPRSPRVIWRILKAGGRIPTRIREHHPFERPEPMTDWEMDFGQLGGEVEFLTVVDRGTSILVDTQTQPHYKAQTALRAVAQLLLVMGLPRKLCFDNDPRFVGNWLADGYPSPLMRFLLCLGVEPALVEPGRPQDKPFVERAIRTLKHECLWVEPPEHWRDADDRLRLYRAFYNHERAHQSTACGNRPPYEAFPDFPPRPSLPDLVDPDAWLTFFHRRIFRRRVGQNGSITVGRHDYYVGYVYAGMPVGVLVDASQQVFHILRGAVLLAEKEIQGLVGRKMAFQDYLDHMLTEVQTSDAL